MPCDVTRTATACGCPTQPGTVLGRLTRARREPSLTGGLGGVASPKSGPRKACGSTSEKRLKFDSNLIRLTAAGACSAEQGWPGWKPLVAVDGSTTEC